MHIVEEKNSAQCNKHPKVRHRNEMVDFLKTISISKTVTILLTLLVGTLQGQVNLQTDSSKSGINNSLNSVQNTNISASSHAFQPESTSIINNNNSQSETSTTKLIENSTVLEKLDTTTSLPETTTFEEVQPIEQVTLGPCTLGTTSRHSQFAVRSKYELTENVLTCSKIIESNYRETFGNFYHQTRLHLQQIEILDSEPSSLFSAIDLICAHFNCSRLTVFNITGIRIHQTEKLRLWLSRWTRLEVLDISNTSISTLNSILQPDFTLKSPFNYLTTLLLDSNNISELDFNNILNLMPKLRHLSVVNNTLISIHCDEILRLRVQDQFETIALAGNAINCDKSQLWLMKHFTDSFANIKFPEHDQIRCSTPERLIEMNWAQRVSVLETPICDECDCRSLKRTAISVDCHNKNLTLVPDVLPLNTKILNLTSNRIMSIGVPQNSKNWENVTYVYLGNNLITSFQPLEIHSKFMRNLAALDIRQNKFQEFPSHIFEQFVNLDQVHLSNNPWLCDCESTFAFQEWLQRQFQKVGDKEEIMCGISGTDENGVRSLNLDQRLSARVIYRLSKSELCPQDSAEEPYDWLDITNTLLGLTIILIITKLALDYVYQYRTKRLPRFFKLNF